MLLQGASEFGIGMGRLLLRRTTIMAMLGLSMTLGGCSSVSSVSSWFTGSKIQTDDNSPPDVIYKSADEMLSNGKYENAAAEFEKVDRQHPYSPFARRSIVMAAYSHFKQGKYPEALSGARRYVTLHPGTKETALAQYIIASSYFDQIKDPMRDQSGTRKALRELQTLVRRYPTSRYAKQAQNRIRIAEDVLAGAEMTVGRFYLKKRNFLAAINRFKVVVKEYQTTKHVEEALMRLTEAYLAMGIKAEAQAAAAVLGHNFPESQWYKDAYTLLQSDGLAPRNVAGSWISSSWKTVSNTLNPFN